MKRENLWIPKILKKINSLPSPKPKLAEKYMIMGAKADKKRIKKYFSKN
tara:strand:+ start:54 stop:200 length:147 start_codon:yes stop_codon:yes gene_type:complete